MESTDFSIRLARSGDRRQADRLFSAHPHMAGVTNIAFNPDRKEVAYVVERAGEVVGCFVLGGPRARYGARTWLEAIVLADSVRGAGIGSVVLSTLPHPVGCCVEADPAHQPLVRWYLGLGFRLLQTRWKRDRTGRIHTLLRTSIPTTTERNTGNGA